MRTGVSADKRFEPVSQHMTRSYAPATTMSTSVEYGTANVAAPSTSPALPLFDAGITTTDIEVALPDLLTLIVRILAGVPHVIDVELPLTD